ncbi:MAG: FHA domain-containing protein, partial [Gammaproteobacteria bacterium]
MAKLVLTFNGTPVSDYALDKEIITIGRKSDNDIHIDNLAVSGHHAKILTILNDSFIEDLGSTNGTFINGNKITKHALQPGEVIVIGKHELKYINEAADAGGDFEKTMIIR